VLRFLTRETIKGLIEDKIESRLTRAAELEAALLASFKARVLRSKRIRSHANLSALSTQKTYNDRLRSKVLRKMRKGA
jgi:hypothetical protein